MTSIRHDVNSGQARFQNSVVFIRTIARVRPTRNSACAMVTAPSLGRETQEGPGHRCPRRIQH